MNPWTIVGWVAAVSVAAVTAAAAVCIIVGLIRMMVKPSSTPAGEHVFESRDAK